MPMLRMASILPLMAGDDNEYGGDADDADDERGDAADCKCANGIEASNMPCNEPLIACTVCDMFPNIKS